MFNKKEWVMDEIRDKVPTTSNQAKGAWGRCIGIPTLYLTANEETKTVQAS
jgi:hypothetical protein